MRFFPSSSLPPPIWSRPIKTVHPPAAGRTQAGSGAGAGTRSPEMRTAKCSPRAADCASMPWLAASRVRFSTAVWLSTSTVISASPRSRACLASTTGMGQAFPTALISTDISFPPQFDPLWWGARAGASRPGPNRADSLPAALLPPPARRPGPSGPGPPPAGRCRRRP